MAKKIQTKSQPKSKPLAKTKVRTIAHIRFNSKGQQRRKGF